MYGGRTIKGIVNLKKICFYSYVSQGAHNSSSYSTIVKQIENYWLPTISLKYFRDIVEIECIDND